MTYYSIATAIIIAQLGLGVSSSSPSWSPYWPGNTGQCVVDPQPGYNFTVSNNHCISASPVFKVWRKDLSRPYKSAPPAQPVILLVTLVVTSRDPTVVKPIIWMAHYTRPSSRQAAIRLQEFRSPGMMASGLTQCNTLYTHRWIQENSQANFIPLHPNSTLMNAHNMHVKMVNRARRCSAYVNISGVVNG